MIENTHPDSLTVKEMECLLLSPLLCLFSLCHSMLHIYISFSVSISHISLLFCLSFLSVSLPQEGDLLLNGLGQYNPLLCLPCTLHCAVAFAHFAQLLRTCCLLRAQADIKGGCLLNM